MINLPIVNIVVTSKKVALSSSPSSWKIKKKLEFQNPDLFALICTFYFCPIGENKMNEMRKRCWPPLIGILNDCQVPTQADFCQVTGNNELIRIHRNRQFNLESTQILTIGGPDKVVLRRAAPETSSRRDPSHENSKCIVDPHNIVTYMNLNCCPLL